MFYRFYLSFRLLYSISCSTMNIEIIGFRYSKLSFPLEFSCWELGCYRIREALKKLPLWWDLLSKCIRTHWVTWLCLHLWLLSFRRQVKNYINIYYIILYIYIFLILNKIKNYNLNYKIINLLKNKKVKKINFQNKVI